MTFRYHIFFTSRSGSLSRVFTYIHKLSRKYRVIIAGYDSQPYPHGHVLIFTKSRIDYRKLHVNGLYVRVKPVKSDVHLSRLIRYIRSHNVTFIYDVNVTSIRGLGGEMDMADGIEDRVKALEEKIERIENAIERLTDLIHNGIGGHATTTANVNANENANATTNESGAIELNFRRMAVRVQSARKGIGLVIRFASYIRPNKGGWHYVVIDRDEAKALIQALSQFVNAESNDGNGGDTETETSTRTSSGSRSRRKGRIKKGYKNALR